MLAGPLAGGIGGAATVDSGGYSVGEATSELYNYINLETTDASDIIGSGAMTQTRALVNLSVASDDYPHGIPSPAVQAQNSLRGAPATGSQAPAGNPLDTYLSGQPAGAQPARPQTVNGTAGPQPSGAIAVTPRTLNGASTALQAQGAATVSYQGDDSYKAGTDATGAVGGGAPAGAPNPTARNSGSPAAGGAPNGVQAPTMNSISGAIVTNGLPSGAGPLTTRILNAAAGSFTIDINGDTVQETINYRLVDFNGDGDYNDGVDTMSLSANDGDWADGPLANGGVNTAGVGDDEVFGNAGGGGTNIWFDNNAPANRVSFNFRFSGTPAAPVAMFYNRLFYWYDEWGADIPINVNVGNFWTLETVGFVITDTDSDGVYETVDLTSNADGDFIDGNNADGIVDQTGWQGNDERVSNGATVSIGTAANRYRYTVWFANDPQETDPDIGITSIDWFTGSLAIDADADGAADDAVNWALGDTNSDGLFDDLEMSTDDGVFGEGLVVADVTGANEDERDGADTYCQLGAYTFRHTYNGNEGFWGVDQTPQVGGANYFAFVATTWFRGDLMLDLDMDGLSDDSVYYVLTDTQSDGVYERMDMSLDGVFASGGALGDAVVAYTGNNDETAGNVVLNNQLYTSQSDLRIVYNDFRVSYVCNPASAGQQNDARLTANCYAGSLLMDVDANGGANDVVSFVVSDTQSDGRTETIDWSDDGALFGAGVLNDKVVASANDERIAGAEGAGTVSSTTALRMAIYSFDTTFSYYPGSMATDVTVLALEYFTGNLSVDVDGTGTARNVAFSMADTNSDGLYETVDLSSDDAQFAEDPAHTGNGALERPGTGHDDERMNADGTLLFKTYSFFVDFDNNPGYDGDDIRITATEYFTNFWSVDTDGDGVLDHVNALLDDTDSNGLYETLELSMGDWEFGEGYNGNGRLRWNDDEIITAHSQLYLGLYTFNLTFDLNPAGDASDAVILAQEGYMGHFNIDCNGDGLASDALYFSLSDSDSEGLFEELELSMGDTVFGEGALSDGIVAAGNDELLSGTGEAAVGGITFHFGSDASPSSGTADATLETLTVHTGSAMIEGIARNAVSADGNSDGIYDALYLDLDGDSVFGDGGALRAGSVLADGTLALTYSIKSMGHTGTPAALVPAGSLATQATSWMVGAISPGGIPCTVVLSDRNNDGTADSADFDTDGDGILDDRGNTEGTLSTLTLGAVSYQVLVISGDASAIRLVAYTRAVLGPVNDVSLGGIFRTGTLSEEASGCDFNGDGDMADSLEIMMADTTVAGVYNGMYLDCNGDRSFVSEQALAQGETVKLGNAVYTVERFSGDGLGASMMQTNLPLSSGKSGPEGMFGLSAPHDGLYWLKVTGGSGWGFATYNGTNGGYGYYLMAGEVKMAASLLKGGALLSGKITDSISGEALPGVLVELYSKTGSLVMSTLSRADGTYRVAGASDSGYGVVFTLTGYITDDGRSGGTLGSLGFSADATDKNIALKKDTIAPTLVLRKPADGEIVSGIVEVAADAADNFKLARVEVSTDTGVSWAPMKGAGTNYTYLWATQSGADGQYTVAVRAVDPGGLSAYQTRTVYVGNERINPTVQFARPLDGNTYGGLLPISVKAGDADGIRKAVFSVIQAGKTVRDLALWQNSATETYNASLDTLRLADGAYTLTATVWDMANNNASASISINVDNTPPQLSKFSAGDREKVRIQAVFADATAVRTVQIRIDNGAWTDMARKDGLTYTYEWRTGESDNGVHKFDLRVNDTLGNQQLYSKQISVNNTPWSLIIGVMLTVLIIAVVAMMARGGKKKGGAG